MRTVPVPRTCGRPGITKYSERRAGPKPASLLSELKGRHPINLPRPNALQRGKTIRNDRKEILNTVQVGAHDHYRNPARLQALLVGDVLIKGEQDIEQRPGQ